MTASKPEQVDGIVREIRKDYTQAIKEAIDAHKKEQLVLTRGLITASA